MSQLISGSMRCRTELTFQVAIRMRERRQIEKLVPQPQDAVAFGLMHAERGSDQIVDEIDLRSCQERRRRGIDQNDGLVALDDQIVVGFGMVDIELVLKAGAAAAFHGDAQHRAVALLSEDLADSAGGPLADGDGTGHDGKSSDWRPTRLFGIPRPA